MPFWSFYYHINWTTKFRQPLITPDWELIIFAAIEDKSKELRAEILAMNAAYDHIHVAVKIPPAKSVGDWVGKVKGYSSRAINLAYELEERFRWQVGYGAMSFGETSLPFVKDYILNQKERHAKNDLNSYLERAED
jgi:putative transposase